MSDQRRREEERRYVATECGHIQKELRRQAITLADDGDAEIVGWRVLTPFTWADGDHFSISLKRDGDIDWYFTDLGSTYMRGTFGGGVVPARYVNVSRVLTLRNVEYVDGELRRYVEDGAYAAALFALAQAMIELEPSFKA